MYKIIKAHPTKEQIASFSMKTTEEDDYVDYVVNLNNIGEEKKRELCSLYNIDINELNQKEKLQLTVSSSI